MQRRHSSQTDGATHTTSGLFTHALNSVCVDTKALHFKRKRNPAKVTGHFTPSTDLVSHNALISIVNFSGRKRGDTQK